MTVLWLKFDCEISRTSISEVFFGFFGPFYDLPRPILGDKTKFCQVKNRLVLVKRIAKEMCNMRVFVHKSTFLGASGGSKHQNFAFFCTFWCPKTQLGVEIFPKKKIFFFRFFDFFFHSDLFWTL